VESMGRQMKAERDKRANILDAEGFRQAAILKAEGEKQSAVLKAEGDKEAAFRQAEARERLAQAEARATAVVSQAIAQGDIQAINYFVAQKYIEALKEMAHSPNQKVFMMPMEATGILGALGGIAELAKDAMAKQPSNDGPTPPRGGGAPRLGSSGGASSGGASSGGASSGGASSGGASSGGASAGSSSLGSAS
jgi:uncharacterized membrane protein YgcG